MSIIPFLFFAVAALPQGTPGQINDPSTYKGSMANQAQEQATSAAQEAQNQQMLNRLDQTYAAYAPKSGGASGGGRTATVPPLKSRPLLPAAKNPLLGMWRMGETKAINLGGLPVVQGTSEIVNGAMGGACASVFGKPDTVIRFTATQFNWVAPDGHDEILNRVEYRSDGANIIVIPTDSDLAMIFGMSNNDHAVVAFFGCTMRRTNTAARRGSQPPAATTAAKPATPATGQAVLSLTVGEMINGALSAPPAGTLLFLTTQDPDANLVRAGFAPDPGGQPIDKLFAACKIDQGGTQQRCNQGMQALTAGTIGQTATGSDGHAVTGAVAPGRYYIVGFTPYKGHSLIWHMPVDLKPGTNAVSLTPQNGSLSH
jgi:hypothetical protein